MSNLMHTSIIFEFLIMWLQSIPDLTNYRRKIFFKKKKKQKEPLQSHLQIHQTKH